MSQRRKERKGNWSEDRGARSARGKVVRKAGCEEWMQISSVHGFIVKGELRGVEEGVKWDDVAMVRCLVENRASDGALSSLLDGMAICPICLEEYICARVARCSHAFCLACILHHLHSVGGEGAKCPCCFSPVIVDELRPVMFTSVQPPKVGNTMAFTHLNRHRTAMAPFTSNPRCDPSDLPFHTHPDALFSRINYVDNDEYLQHLHTDHKALTQALNANPHPTQQAFLTMALQHVINQIHSISSLPQPKHYPLDTPDTPTHFYQASDGQLCFLSHFNMQCLSHQFPDKHFPPIITAKILQVTPTYLTPQLHKRLSFLNHLPTHIHIYFIELDLNRILSIDTILHFQPQFQQHAKQRKNIKLRNKKQDKIAKQRQRQQIDSLVSQFQHMNPDTTHEDIPESFLGDEFGPALVRPPTKTLENSPPPKQKPVLNFRRVCTSRQSPQTLWPELATASPTKKPTATVWNAKPKIVSADAASSNMKGKKGKPKKIVLLSTSAARHKHKS